MATIRPSRKLVALLVALFASSFRTARAFEVPFNDDTADFGVGDPPQVQQEQLRRRLNNEREECPQNSLYHCQNPARIMDDPTVACNWDSKDCVRFASDLT